MSGRHDFNLNAEERQDKRKDRLFKDDYFFVKQGNLSSFKLRSHKRRLVQKAHDFAIPPNVCSSISLIPNYLVKLQDDIERFSALNFLCNLIVEGGDFALNNLMKQDFIPLLLRCIEMENYPSMQHRALWIAIQIGFSSCDIYLLFL
jgi:hypothetical protein